jgi:hypothetical protein
MDDAQPMMLRVGYQRIDPVIRIGHTTVASDPFPRGWRHAGEEFSQSHCGNHQVIYRSGGASLPFAAGVLAATGRRHG